MLRTFKNIHHCIYTSLYLSFDFIPPCICSHLVSTPSLYLLPPPRIYSLPVYALYSSLSKYSPPLYLPLVSTPSCSLLPSKLMIYIPWTAQHLDTTRDKNIFSCVLIASPPFFYSFSSVILNFPPSF